MIRNTSLFAIAIFLAACSSMKVAELDPITGRFPTKNTATVVKNEKVDLDALKALLLLPDNDFIKGQIGNVNYWLLEEDYPSARSLGRK